MSSQGPEKASSLGDYVRSRITETHVDLQGLVVLTEAATGTYCYNPSIAALAGAQVIAVAKDSSYGSWSDAFTQVYAGADELALDAEERSRLLLLGPGDAPDLSSIDIVTNSGLLRPFTRDFFRQLKPTAVLSLMWEPWELREGEIDLTAASEYGIEIMGTDESHPLCDMRPYPPMIAIELIRQAGEPLFNWNWAFLGDHEYLAPAMAERLSHLGVKTRWARTSESSQEFESCLEWADAIVVAEHASKDLLVGDGDALISVEKLVIHKVDFVGVVSGLVDGAALAAHGIRMYPHKCAGPQVMSFPTFEIGPFPVIDLFVGGLSVGGALARGRRMGLTGAELVKHAKSISPAMPL